LAVLEREDQDLVRGFIVNKFRGTKELLQGGVDQLTGLTGRATYGILPYQRGLELDAEDATDLTSWLDVAAPLGPDILTIGALALPRASNLTDLDPLVDEPGVVLRPIYRPEEMRGCDLVILPGTRATVSDLHWLRERHFDQALSSRAEAGQAILGLCGGYQMLGSVIDDDVESRSGRVQGLGLLPVRTVFQSEKVLTQTRRALNDGTTLRGYEIHHGRVDVEGGEPLFADEGCVSGSVAGTLWHGLFENDQWRRQYLLGVAQRSGKSFVPDGTHDFAARRETRIDVLADLVEEHLDTNGPQMTSVLVTSIRLHVNRVSRLWPPV
jgi:adenosylcobyric acid synthase